MTEQQQSHFEGWAIVEQMGHNRYAGFVTTEAFGQAVLFRIDVPALAERERTTRRPEYVGDRYCPAGTVVQESAVQGYTKYIGPGSLFALTPCSEETCIAAVEEIQPRKVMALRLPDRPALGIDWPSNGDKDHGLEDDADRVSGDLSA